MKHSVRTSLAAGLMLLLLTGSFCSCADSGQESGLPSAVSDVSLPSASSGSSEGSDGAGSGDMEQEPLSDDSASLPDAAEEPLPDASAVVESPAEDKPAAEDEPAVPTPEEALEIAMGYVGRSVADLIAVIGEPGDKDYAPSCMGPGEDGNLYYDGFTVYTYLEDGEETIQDVE